MTEHHKKNQFIKVPRYPGGNPAFREFIAENLRYPAEAQNAGIEGSVVVEYDISDNGVVENPRVLKGLGHGCDEEAIRVVGLLRFEKVRNRGVRVKITTKTTLHFRLPKAVVNYALSPKKNTHNQEPGSGQKADTPVVYSYTIKF
jgi:TonB family protein